VDLRRLLLFRGNLKVLRTVARANICLLVAAAAAFAQNRPYSVEKVIGGFQNAGSVTWNRDHLLVGDVPAGKITSVSSVRPSVWREGTYASGLAVDSDGRVYVCDSHEHRLLRIDAKKNKEDVIADRFEGQRLSGPTAVTVSKNNHVFFTDSAFASADKDRALAHYGIYHVSPKGELSIVAKMTSRPNGIVLSGDGKALYVVDSDARSVIAWDIDRAGAASNQRVLLRTKNGVPNGIAVGSDGKLYVAARYIEVYDKSGKLEAEIELSEKPNELTFGDADSVNLYVAAHTSLYRVRFNPDAQGGKTN
jgi:gluconolactonase